MIKTKLHRNEYDGVAWYTFKEIAELHFLKHWITSRQGGVSDGGYKGLNLGDHVGDADSNVSKNLKTVSSLFCEGRKIYLPNQVHSNRVAEISSPGGKSRKDCDAVVVESRETPIGVLTADCLPVLIVDPHRKVAGVVHAGRMGVFMDIAGETVRKLETLFGAKAREMIVAIGPGIRECCYEVGEDVFSGYENYARYRNSAGRLDMVTAVADSLSARGILNDNIFDCDICTSCKNDEFFSHRKQGLSGEKAGRFMTGLEIF
ncbi:MAG: peptidoglycan editing factor PgeF [Nitrospinota bacterium]|nr:peptidoglycan editing factor PgeF [Nitrospinota bacterium]